MNTDYTVRVANTDVTVTVTSMSSVVESELRALKSSVAYASKLVIVAYASKLVIGLDVEWNSADSNAKPALLQLCSGTRCLVVQLLHMPHIPKDLKDFLADRTNTFVGVGIQSDVAKLYASHGLACANAVELSTLAAAENPNAAGCGLVRLARYVCGVSIEKSESVARSDWSAHVLVFEQIKYAAIDAFAAYLIGAKLLQAA